MYEDRFIPYDLWPIEVKIMQIADEWATAYKLRVINDVYDFTMCKEQIFKFR